jgi:hypothetical protein
MMTKAASTSETSVNVYQTTRETAQKTTVFILTAARTPNFASKSKTCIIFDYCPLPALAFSVADVSKILIKTINRIPCLQCQPIARRFQSQITEQRGNIRVSSSFHICGESAIGTVTQPPSFVLISNAIYSTYVTNIQYDVMSFFVYEHEPHRFKGRMSSL